ncbi:ABC transporter permease [Chitinophaga vietnamensis]|uniref:ABC transporter permease n=1 Tax=Chitinophaga vietnamensis TaxID=2593957 RepID=UPI001178A89E|nr:ABC transporter permease [Chitinophaga vietnamensis]
MLKNYIKTAWRNIRRNKLFSALNIFGLATGMACSILIFLWVQDETSYDRFHPHADHTYRVITHLSGTDVAYVPIAMAPAIKAEIPGVKMATRLSPLECVVGNGVTRYNEKNGYYADSNLLRMFNFPLLRGDLNAALTQPNTIVLTEKTAIKYFGSADKAMGETLNVMNDYKGNNVTVTAILQDLPHNSHLQFDMLLPISMYLAQNDPNEWWNNFDVYTYFQTNDAFKASPTALEHLSKQITAMRFKYSPGVTEGAFSLQALPDIHLQSNLLFDPAGQGNILYVRIFSLVAVFILLIACINFMNLATALSGERAKEVGMRKAIGATRAQLAWQFISESLLIATISMMLAAVVAACLLPAFNHIVDKNISFHLLNIRMVAGLLGIALIAGFIAGSYPAIFLSSFQPVKVLKGMKMMQAGGAFFRNGLVVAQFTISVVILISTLVVYYQLQYIRHRDIGFNKEGLLYVPLPTGGDLIQRTKALHALLDQQAEADRYSIISHLPSFLSTGTTSISWPGKDPKNQTIFPQMWVDNQFQRVMGANLLAGRFFSKDFQGDEKNFVVNETALKVMGKTPENALGMHITMNGRYGEIIGVLKDFNFKPLQYKVEPLVLKNGQYGDLNGNPGFIVVRTSVAQAQQTISDLQKSFRAIYQDTPFSYDFLDADISRQYLSEQRMGKLFNIFSLLSVIISCLGLFGLATFTTRKRIREIGVRKVLGASVPGIVAMLSKDFIKLVGLSMIAGFPLAAWAMNKWLSNFAYRIQLSWWMFAIGGFTCIMIALLTVSYQSVRAALANPVKSLRTE